MKTRKDKFISANILTFVRDNHVATAELKKSSDGWCADWFISTNLCPNITFVGNVTLPIYGETEEEATRKANFMADGIIDFVLTNVGGSAKLDKSPDKDSKVAVGLAHLVAHRGIYRHPSVTSQTTLEYLFLVDQVGYVAKPAQVLAELDDLSMSTLKRRVGRGIYGY